MTLKVRDSGTFVAVGGGGGGGLAPAVDPANGVYSQVSLNGGNTAATNAGMTAVTPGTTETATANNNPAWIAVDYGEDVTINRILMRSPTTALVGGWGTDIYAGSSYVQIQVDGSSDWITVGAFAPINGIWNGAMIPGTLVVSLVAGDFVTLVYPDPLVARRVRLIRQNAYMALTGFYCDYVAP